MSGYSFPPPGYGYGQGQQPTAPPIAQPYAASSAPYSSSPSAPPQHLKPSSAPYAPGGYAPLLLVALEDTLRLLLVVLEDTRRLRLRVREDTERISTPYPADTLRLLETTRRGLTRTTARSRHCYRPCSRLGTDPNIVACFQVADQDGSGFIDDKELQRALSSYNQSFSMRTVHLSCLLSLTQTPERSVSSSSNCMAEGIHFSVSQSQHWRDIFERADRDRSGKIDPNELREALLSVGYSVSPVVLDLLVSKFDKTGGRNRAIEYDNFVECCLTVKGLSEKFKAKDPGYTGSATFTYEAFMLAVLPFSLHRHQVRASERELSSYNQSFNKRTVHLLMFTFALNKNTRKIDYGFRRADIFLGSIMVKLPLL
ncbi:hypothetical protein LWI28_012182 [Acer negundo]|uniref:EF-hand domain-containing protein n=1 Tax=Acer negundo TaxID=4023 RepID=A0AAD5IDU1_ACENE|nr:hypothetical protein LWI28_012182 [Acer negundo]